MLFTKWCISNPKVGWSHCNPRKVSPLFTQTGAAGREERDAGPSVVVVVHPDCKVLLCKAAAPGVCTAVYSCTEEGLSTPEEVAYIDIEAPED